MSTTALLLFVAATRVATIPDCPFSMTAYDCGFLGTNQISIPTPKRPPTQLLQKMFGRHVVIVGDSLSRQLFIALACLFREDLNHAHAHWLNRARERLGNASVTKCGPKHCELASGPGSSFLSATARFMRPAWTLSFVWETANVTRGVNAAILKHNLDLCRREGQDALVVNVGNWGLNYIMHAYGPLLRNRSHGVWEARIRSAAISRVTELSMVLPARVLSASVLWRDVAPLRFATPTGFMQQTTDKESIRCDAARPLVFDPVALYNKVAARALTRLGVTIVPTKGRGASVVNAGVPPDCAHYCQTGAPVQWALDVLAALTKLDTCTTSADEQFVSKG